MLQTRVQLGFRDGRFRVGPGGLENREGGFPKVGVPFGTFKGGYIGVYRDYIGFKV